MLSSNGTGGAASSIILKLTLLLFAALSVSADRLASSYSLNYEEEGNVTSSKGRYLRNESVATLQQDRDLLEDTETQVVDCSNETRTFTAFVKLGLVFQSDSNDTSADDQSQQNQTNTTTGRDRTGLTRKQRQALEDSFQVAYNELSFQACDRYFRAVDKIQLVIRRPNATISSNDTNSNSNTSVTRSGLLQNPDEYLDWDLSLRSLPNTSDYDVTSTTEAVSTVFKIEGSCRDCPVAETGQFALFDDSFRRRILLGTNQAVEALALKKDSHKNRVSFLDRHHRNLQANNTNATSCVCPVPQTEIPEAISKSLRSASGTPSSKQQLNATGLQRLAFLVQFAGEVNELEEEGVLDDTLKGIWDLQEDERYVVDCDDNDDDGGCELEDDDGYWENVDFGDDDTPFDDDDNWWDIAITDDDDGIDDTFADDGVNDVGTDDGTDDMSMMDDGVNNDDMTDDSPTTGISITIGGMTDDSPTTDDSPMTDDSPSGISVTIGGTTDDSPADDGGGDPPTDPLTDSPTDSPTDPPEEEEEEDNDDGGTDDGGTDDGGTDDGGTDDGGNDDDS